MYRIILLSFVSIIFLISCRQTSIISNKNVENVRVAKIENFSDMFTEEIHEKVDIDEIIYLINKGEREPRKFVSNYRLEIRYFDGSMKSIFIKDVFFNIDGLTYRTNVDLSEKLRLLLEVKQSK